MMLDSVGGIITIGAFLLLFVVFGLFAHRRASASSPARDEPRECAASPIILDVPLIPVVDVPRPWADIMPLSVQYHPDELPAREMTLQVNTIIIMPTQHKPCPEKPDADPKFFNFAVGKAHVPLRRRVPDS